eukprot:4537766-Prymnesium_polylepis.1
MGDTKFGLSVEADVSDMAASPGDCAALDDEEDASQFDFADGRVYRTSSDFGGSPPLSASSISGSLTRLCGTPEPSRPRTPGAVDTSRPRGLT